MSPRQYRLQPARLSKPSPAQRRRRDGSICSTARGLAKAAKGRIRNQAYGQAGIVNACTILEGSRKLVVVDDQSKAVLSAVATRRPDPRRVDIALTLGAESVELPGSVHVDTGRQAAWLCLGQSCLPPIVDPSELENALRS
jgi:uncharacterized protein YyaL (SSP411 family)